jgi:DNA-binding response OmpR family regulator
MKMPIAPLDKIIRHGDLVIDWYAARVKIGSDEVSLTVKEYLILLMLAKNMGDVIALDEIIASVWGREGSYSKNVVYITISRLRNKIEDDPKNPIHIVTKKNIGYSMPMLPTA